MTRDGAAAMQRLSTRLRRLGAHTALVLAVTVGATGCDFQPAELTVPGAGVDGPTYHLTIEFANVLNLPPGAKVFADGVRVGELTGLSLVDPVPATSTTPARQGYVVAEVVIRSSVRLPEGTTAALRQETPLGDVHIALRVPPDGSARALASGARIPLSRTEESVPIEDIFAGLATFVGSGAVTDFQSIVAKLNAILPDDPRETARIAGTLGADISDLGDHLNSVDALLDGIGATVDQGVLRNVPMLDELLSPYGAQHTIDTINAEIGIIFVLTALGPVAPSVRWLAPLVQSLDGTARAVVPMLFGSRPLDIGSPSNLKQVVDLVQNKIIPFVERGPKLDVTGVSTGARQPARLSPAEQTDRIVDTLRMIGVIR
ncbi:MlaD family protein [Nocardia inohanensis]|uniref:MlaD family protein n=1 Tax=Nocardia inohanensis TaxID=209246 RepID=UPI000B0E7460|nr:MlaD family protein [Nocardia inohanensis]